MSATRDHTELRKARRALRKIKSNPPSKDATPTTIKTYANNLVKITAAYVILTARALYTPTQIRVPCMACEKEMKIVIRNIHQFDEYDDNAKKQRTFSAIINGESLCSNCVPSCVVCDTDLEKITINQRSGLPVCDHWEECGPRECEDLGWSVESKTRPRTGCRDHPNRIRPAKGCLKCYASLAIAHAATNKIANVSE